MEGAVVSNADIVVAYGHHLEQWSDFNSEWMDSNPCMGSPCSIGEETLDNVVSHDVGHSRRVDIILRHVFHSTHGVWFGCV